MFPARRWAQCNVYTYHMRGISFMSCFTFTIILITKKKAASGKQMNTERFPYPTPFPSGRFRSAGLTRVAAPDDQPPVWRLQETSGMVTRHGHKAVRYTQPAPKTSLRYKQVASCRMRFYSGGYEDASNPMSDRKHSRNATAVVGHYPASCFL
jgi:hypothetical protein